MLNIQVNNKEEAYILPYWNLEPFMWALYFSSKYILLANVIGLRSHMYY
jgi:hypothetical protein